MNTDMMVKRASILSMISETGTTMKLKMTVLYTLIPVHEDESELTFPIRAVQEIFIMPRPSLSCCLYTQLSKIIGPTLNS